MFAVILSFLVLVSALCFFLIYDDGVDQLFLNKDAQFPQFAPFIQKVMPKHRKVHRSPPTTPRDKRATPSSPQTAVTPPPKPPKTVPPPPAYPPPPSYPPPPATPPPSHFTTDSADFTPPSSTSSTGPIAPPPVPPRPDFSPKKQNRDDSPPPSPRRVTLTDSHDESPRPSKKPSPLSGSDSPRSPLHVDTRSPSPSKTGSPSFSPGTPMSVSSDELSPRGRNAAVSVDDDEGADDGAPAREEPEFDLKQEEVLPRQLADALASPTSASPHTETKQEKDERKRELIKKEVVSTEVTYVQWLKHLVEHFLHPLRDKAKTPGSKLTLDQVQHIFSNVEPLCDFHTVFLADLQRTENIPSVFLKYADYLKMYTQYVNDYDLALKTIDSLKRNRTFQTFLEDHKKAPHYAGLDIMSYLISPVQRIPRYALLLKELKKYTPEGHPEYKPLTSALTKIESIAAHVNEAKARVANMSKILQIQNKMTGFEGESLLQPYRRYIVQGSLPVHHKSLLSDDATIPREFVLFNDMLLVVNKSFKFKAKIDLRMASVRNFDGRHKSQTDFEIISPAVSMQVFCRSEAEKQKWFNSLRTAIDAAKDAFINRGASDNDKHKRSGSVEQNLLIQQALEERKQKRHEAKDRATHILQDSLQSLHSRDQSTSSSQ